MSTRKQKWLDDDARSLAAKRACAIPLSQEFLKVVGNCLNRMRLAWQI
jgi:hypothetical protein